MGIFGGLILVRGFFGGIHFFPHSHIPATIIRSTKETWFLLFRVVFNQLTVDVKPKSVLTGAIIDYGS